MHSPGTTPAMNRAPIDTPAITPYMTKGTLGGITGPMQLEAPVIAREKSSS